MKKEEFIRLTGFDAEGEFEIADKVYTSDAEFNPWSMERFCEIWKNTPIASRALMSHLADVVEYHGKRETDAMNERNKLADELAKTKETLAEAYMSLEETDKAIELMGKAWVIKHIIKEEKTITGDLLEYLENNLK